MNAIIYLKNDNVIELTDVVRYMYLNSHDMYCFIGKSTEIKIALENILMIVTENETKKVSDDMDIKITGEYGVIK